MRQTPTPVILFALVLFAAPAADALAQVKAQVPAGAPAWSKGIQPISRESYYSAIECGKQPGAQPACVFYDAALCKNAEFTLAMYTPYKKVAYEVWAAVSQKRPAPQPSYPEAQRTRVVLGIKSARPGANPVTAVTVKRGATVVKPATQTLDAGGGTFIFDFPAFAPTGNLTLEIAGKEKSVTCAFDQAALARMR